MREKRTRDNTWFNTSRDLWIMLPPSRRLRKLYRELEALDVSIEQARNRRYVPHHAPSDFSIRRRIVNDLMRERFDLVKRIDLLQNE